MKNNPLRFFRSKIFLTFLALSILIAVFIGGWWVRIAYISLYDYTRGFHFHDPRYVEESVAYADYVDRATRHKLNDTAQLDSGTLLSGDDIPYFLVLDSTSGRLSFDTIFRNTNLEYYQMIDYGKDLIMHTARYLGPKGIVGQFANNTNCQNCHLYSGTKPFGNSLFDVQSSYPQFVKRSGSVQTVATRINNCMKRSMNGKPLPIDSRELIALQVYIASLGYGVPAGTVPFGSGLKEITYLDRAANPETGKKLYLAKCQSCHMPDGQGVPSTRNADGYKYPPVWGPNSFNNGASLYRLTFMARFIKYNMP